jgi:uncharacterized protein (DUF2267 family)
MSTVRAFAQSVQVADRWVADLARALELDNDEAYRVLRAVLHALRDRIPHDESAQLAAQLPLIVRGAYYEGWRPSSTPETYHGVEPFLRRIAVEAQMAGETEASFAAQTTVGMLRRHVSEGEVADVLAALPAPVRALLSGAGETRE